MKHFFSIVAIIATASLFAQSNSTVFLYDLKTEGNSFSISNPINISKTEGYNSQPSFLNERYIVFSSERNGQTDIAQFDMRYNGKTWINFSEGSEYTPLKIPNKREISAVRLDKDGKQRLYSYQISGGASKELIPNSVVAYYTWADENTVVSAVIEDKDLNLFATTINDGKSRKYATKVGRSFHKIPNSDLVSFIAKGNENQWQIKSLNPKTGATKLIANTIEGVEDICWLNAKTLISAKDNSLYKLTLNRDNNWKKVTDLPNVKSISRLVVNPEATKIVIVTTAKSEASNEETENNTNSNDTNDNASATEPSEVEKIVQRNLDAYNAKDLEVFMADYTEDVKLYNYPNELRTDGKDAMRKGYADWFKRAKGLKAEIKKRIVIGNKVIDHEEVTANGQTFEAVAIYEVENGKITKVTFMR